MQWIFIFTFIGLILLILSVFWLRKSRKYESVNSVASSYDAWTNDRLLEKLWGEHIHLGFYEKPRLKKDFRKAKIDFVHELVHWSGLNKLPKGSRILDVGCGIGGSARILSNDYGFDVIGISISSEQIKRANELTTNKDYCRFEVMNALDLKFEKSTFDGVWSVEAGPHIFDKQKFADEMLRVLRPGGVLAIADWNQRDPSKYRFNFFEKFIMNQLLIQWTHPEFSSIEGFKNNLLNSPYCGSSVEAANWTKYTIQSWNESIYEGFRRPIPILKLGLRTFIKAFREIPTILMMRWAFSRGLMRFGVFKSRG
ncbi:methyltransferase domain-containing protein [Prochlorococcus marinus]|uniref:SAM-dependent methyltransferase n=1 Tax=Prochlorococcus marinus XMU1408 TaxID=2213228 RepID=A0A318R7Y3_PROMR|nr:methyltransferase domain-containing protein [Prochlorococcus marinus]MBW3042721.1 SAM-dependent methyltransferase [Prochlorococcus marinus str. XMU1408]PYE01408.1 SAM-dependent methyltransferase [Prochlorococcus marinus XMU1408]